MQSFITVVVSLYYSGKYSIIDKEVTVDYLLYSGVQMTLAIGIFLVLIISCSSTATEVVILIFNNAIKQYHFILG